jgi:hypothetical protein
MALPKFLLDPIHKEIKGKITEKLGGSDAGRVDFVHSMDSCIKLGRTFTYTVKESEPHYVYVSCSALSDDLFNGHPDEQGFYHPVNIELFRVRAYRPYGCKAAKLVPIVAETLEQIAAEHDEMFCL